MRSPRISRLILVLSASLLCVQCGKKSTEEDQVAFEVLPTSPIVFDTDLVINAGSDDEITYNASWMRVKFKITNNSTKDVTIQSFKVKVTAVSDTGAFETADLTIDPSSVNNNESSFWASVGPGESTFMTAKIGGVDFEPTFIVADMPAGEKITNFRFRVEVEPIGWFGTEDEQLARFKKKFRFNTQ